MNDFKLIMRLAPLLTAMQAAGFLNDHDCCCIFWAHDLDSLLVLNFAVRKYYDGVKFTLTAAASAANRLRLSSFLRESHLRWLTRPPPRRSY